MEWEVVRKSWGSELDLLRAFQEVEAADPRSEQDLLGELVVVPPLERYGRVDVHLDDRAGRFVALALEVKLRKKRHVVGREDRRGQRRVLLHQSLVRHLEQPPHR